MCNINGHIGRLLAVVLVGQFATAQYASAQIGQEVSAYERLEDGEEFTIPLRDLLRRGELAFRAQWTPEEGGGRPFSKGVGAPLSNPASPLAFPRNFKFRIALSPLEIMMPCRLV